VSEIHEWFIYLDRSFVGNGDLLAIIEDPEGHVITLINKKKD